MMAKKVRKKSAAKAVKSSKAKKAAPARPRKAAKKSRAKTAPRKVAARKAPARKAPARKQAKPETITHKLAKGFQFVVDTIEETNKLRDKLEPPGTSETQ